MALPAWAKETEAQSAEVNVDQAYPIYLKGLEPFFPNTATPAFKSAVAKVCITRDLRKLGYTSVRYRGDRAKFSAAALDGATDAAGREAADAQYEAGQKSAGKIRDRWLKDRAAALTIPE